MIKNKEGMNFKMVLAVLLILLLPAMGWASGETESTKDDLVELVYYHIGPGEQLDQGLVEDKINSILSEKIGATLKIVHIGWGDYDQKMQVVTASGEPYDLAWTGNWSNSYSGNVDKGAFLPLDDLISKYAPAYADTVPQKFRNVAKIKGKTYGMLNWQMNYMANAWRAPASIMDKAIEKIDFDINKISSLKDFEPYLEFVKSEYPEVYAWGAAGGEPGFANWNKLLVTNGFDDVVGRTAPGYVRLADNTRTVVNQFKSDEFRNYVLLMADWAQKGYIQEDAIALPGIGDLYGLGKVGMMLDGNFYPHPGSLTLAESNGSRTYSEMFKAPNNPTIMTSSSTATLTAISRTSKNPEKAIQFFELLYSDKDFLNLINYGIEGVHYNMAGDNTIVKTQVGTDRYNPDVRWVYGPGNMESYLMEGESKLTRPAIAELNDSATPSSVLGFTFDSNPVKAEMSAVSTIIDEYSAAFECGIFLENTEAELKTFLDKIRKSGGDAIVKEAQQQIDAFYSN
ncbi:MAG: ABC transporter substrate-binding protein [Spirochaetaceae bacterium]